MNTADVLVSELKARQVPCVAIVADDQQGGISVSGHLRRYGEPLFSLLGPTRLDQVAEGFGCHGVRVEDKAQLVPTVRAALTADRPAVVHVPIVPGGPGD
jgi:acetolactate synthase-1/2/3 large subunit